MSTRSQGLVMMPASLWNGSFNGGATEAATDVRSYRRVIFQQFVSIMSTAFLDAQYQNWSSLRTPGATVNNTLQHPSNTTSAPPPLESYSKLEEVLIIFAGTLLSVVTAGGNLLVILSFKIDKSIQTISNYFLLSLAVADFAIGIISCPFMTIYTVQGEWPFGYVACQFWLCIDYLMSNASVWNLLLISLDRYFSVTMPLTYRPRRTTNKAILMIASTYVLSLVLWPPWIVAWPYIEGEFVVPDNQCMVQFLQTNPTFSIITIIVAFYLPVAVMVGLYARVFYETEKRQREVKKLQGFHRTLRKRAEQGQEGELPHLNRAPSKATMMGRSKPKTVRKRVERFFRGFQKRKASQNHTQNMKTSTVDADDSSGDTTDDVASIKDSTSCTFTRGGSVRAAGQNNLCQSHLLPLLQMHHRLYHQRQMRAKRQEMENCNSVIENVVITRMASKKSLLSECKDDKTYSVLIKLGEDPNEVTMTNEPTDTAPKIIILEDDEDKRLSTPPSCAKSDETTSLRENLGSSVRKVSSQQELNSRSNNVALTLTNHAAAGGRTLPNTSSLPRGGTANSSHKPAKRKPDAHKSSQERKAAKTLSAILLAFILTWAPYSIIICIVAFAPEAVPAVWFTFSYYLCYLNSTINPLCYALCNANFRQTYVRILTCKWKKPSRQGQRTNATISAMFRKV